MQKYFSKQEQISINDLYILLNDDFINELSHHIKSDAPEIIQKTIVAYLGWYLLADLNRNNIDK